MDKNSVIGFVLIGLVLMLWMWMNAPSPQQKSSGPSDTTATHAVSRDTPHVATQIPKSEVSTEDTLGEFFSRLAVGEDRTITVETSEYRARISTKGGCIKSWELKNYKTWNQYPAELITSNSGGDFHLLFSTSDGKLIDTKHLYFVQASPNGQVINLEKVDSARVDLVLQVNDRSRIVKSFIFYNNRSSFDAVYRFEEMQDIISNFEYQVTWESGLRYAERNSIDESSFANASTFSGGEITEIDAKNFDEPVKQSVSGRVSWVATRTKYFAVAIIPRERESQGAYLEGNRKHQPDNGALENYSIALKMPFLGKSVETDRFSIFLGPLKFDDVKNYGVGLEQMMSLGAAWVIRPISEYVIIPVFKFLHLFIPNFGVVLIIFSFIIKIVLHPLTKSSMKSMQKMQALQPMMTEIREKCKDDPQRLNQQTMRLYKEYGVNPAGGCLPMILQMPILYALWSVFRSTIELRQASFVWWIDDLSAPDVITKLPFSIPIFNITELSGLALLMGITMFVQQKMSVKDPRQKMMVWMMPVLMTLLFNSFPSGLNLYYFVFNLLSIGQQAWINKQHKNEPLRPEEEKKGSGGFLNRMTKGLPKLNR